MTSPDSYIAALYRLSTLEQTEVQLSTALQIVAETLSCSVAAIHRGRDELISLYDPDHQSAFLEKPEHTLNIALQNGNVGFATLAFGSALPKIFNQTEQEFGHLVGQWMSATLEKTTLISVLQESEIRFRQMAENIHDVFWMTDPAKNQMLYISPAYERIWGRTVASLYANPMSFVEAIHADDRARVITAFSQQVLGTYDIEYRVVQPGGAVRWVRDVAYPIQDESGTVYRVVGVARDITDRKHIDEKLAASEAQYRSLVQNSPDFIIVVDHDLKLTFINHIQPPLTAEQVIGSSALAFVPPDYHGVMQETIDQVFATGQPGIYEIVGQGAGGQLSWYRTRVIPIHQDDGRIETVLLVAGDITEAQQKTLQLEVLNRLQQAILDNADYTIITTLPDGTITLFNKAAEEKLGYSAEEVVGKTSPAIIHDPYEVAKRADILSFELGRKIEPGFEVFVAKTNQLGVPDQNEWTYIRKDGTRFPVLLAVTALRDENANITGYLGIAADITERRQAEQEREFLIKELEDALLFKDQFLATMSHELRTPLNAIQGYAGLIIMEDLENPEVNHMAERIDSNSRRLLSLINDILDISRINANRIEIVQRPIALHELVKNWHGDFSQIARERHLNFDLELDANLPTHIVGDEERLTQITANLLQNAFKFTEVGRVVLRVAAGGEGIWQIIVSDTGPGIPQTWHYLIFDEFRQVDGSSRRKYGGAGLGLSIVKKLSMLMGGTVTVESMLGQGSTFIVTLPLKINAATPTH